MAKQSKNEALKKELSLSVSPFATPQEYTGKRAWANLIINLLNIDPGTYPTMPLLGVGLRSYEFSFMDDIKYSLTEKIRAQIAKYLPEIPIADISLDTLSVEHRTVLMINIKFSNELDNSIMVVAAEKVGSIINFAVNF